MYAFKLKKHGFLEIPSVTEIAFPDHSVDLLKGKLSFLMAFSLSFYPRGEKGLSHRSSMILIFNKSAKPI